MKSLAFLVLVLFYSVGRAAAKVEPRTRTRIRDKIGRLGAGPVGGPALDSGWKFSFVDVPTNLRGGRETTLLEVFRKHKGLRSVFTRKRSQRLDKAGNTKVYEFVFTNRRSSQFASFGESSCSLEEANFVAALDEIEALEVGTSRGKQVVDVMDTDGGDLGSRFESFEEGIAVTAKSGKAAGKKNMEKSTDCNCMLAKKTIKKKIPRRSRRNYGGKKYKEEEIHIVQCPDNCTNNKAFSTFVAQDFKARGKCM